MKDWNEISENEIRILGFSDGPEHQDKHGQSKSSWLAFLGAVAICLLGVLITKLFNHQQPTSEPSYFEPATITIKETPRNLFDTISISGCTIIKDTTINDVGLRLYMPAGASATLHVGRPPIEDDSIIYIAQAADIRADNHKILGAFVMDGKPLAWGLSKKGYCAIIDNQITVGVSDNSPLFEEATEKGGHFFRQYPLVDNGTLCENEPKNKTLRRAICTRKQETFMAHSTDAESFHDFAQALVDLGVDNAIYLVGSEAYGWALLADDSREEWGIPRLKTLPKNTSYIVFRRE